MDDQIAYNIGSLPPLPSGSLLNTDMMEVERPSGVPDTPNDNYRITGAQLRAALSGDSAETGDMLITARSPGADWLNAGAVYSQASYPELFSLVGAMPDAPPGVIYNVVTIASGNVRAVNHYARISSTKLIGVGNARVVWMSYDNGRSWTSKTITSFHPDFSYVAMTSIGLFIGTTGGSLLRSTDEGETFTDLPAPSAVPVISISEYLGRVFVCTSGGETFRSDNAGVATPTWTSLGIGALVAVKSFGNGIVLAFPYESTSLRRSVDNGTTWSPYSPGITSPSSFGADRIWANDKSMVISNSSGAAITQDYGTTWTQTLSASSINQIRSIGGRLIGVSGSTSASSPHRYSDDFGKTWSSSPSSGDTNRSVFLEDAFGISLYRTNGTTNLQRSSFIFDYDETTQFRTPRIDGLRGVNGYIKK